MSNEHQEKKNQNTGLQTKTIQFVKQKIDQRSANILLRGFKFKPTPMHNNIELKSNMQDYMRRF